MKTLFVFVVCIIFNNIWVRCDDATAAREEIDAAKEKCMTYFGASDDDAKGIEDLSFTTSAQKCTMYCKYRELNLMDGLDFSEENILTIHKRIQANQESVLKNAETNVETCVGKGNALKSTKDPCEMAVEFHICMKTLIKEQSNE